jgi:hypothetical protein
MFARKQILVSKYREHERRRGYAGHFLYGGTELAMHNVQAQELFPQTLSMPGTPLAQSFQIHLPEAASGMAAGAHHRGRILRCPRVQIPKCQSK